MDNWAIFGATLVGPILAVMVTLWYQDYSAGRTIRMSLFATMMRFRQHPANPEFVGSLNVVPLFFNKSTTVLERHKQLIAVYEDAGWNSENADVLSNLNGKVREHIALLLAAMASKVGRPIGHLDILKSYSPKGWADDETKLNEIRDGFRALLKGEIALPVLAFTADNALSTQKAASDTPTSQKVGRAAKSAEKKSAA